MTVIADTLRAKKLLVEAGFSDEKAEGIVAVFQEADAQIATKLDLELLRKDLTGRIDKVDNKIDSLEINVNTRIDSLEINVNTRIDSLRTSMNASPMKAQFASVVATVAILSALRFFV